MFRRMMATLAASLMISGTAGLLAPSAASAAGACNSGYQCFYDNMNGTSLISSTFATLYTRNVCYPLSGSENNSISYINNASSSTFYVYLNGSCSGTSSPVYANSYGAMNSTWNNTISSLMRIL